MKSLYQYFDHTNLKAEATELDIATLCNEAREYGFYAVCVNSRHLLLAKEKLAGSGVKVAVVVGFPLGACSSEVKALEAEWVCRHGADELDMVLAVGAMKDRAFDYVQKDIAGVVKEARKTGALVKVILETCLLTEDEIVKACILAETAGADFVKTSTGFSTGGAMQEHVRLMKETVGDRLLVKASGGMRTLEDVKKIIEAGADRIGASASVQIMKELRR